MSITKATKRFQKPTYSTLREGAASLGELDELFSKVASLEERDQPFRRVLQPLHNGLAVFELVLRKAAGERLECLAVALFPVEDDHSLHSDPVDEHRAHVAIGVRLRRVVFGDEAAHHDARAHPHQLQHRIEDFAAHVLEMHVHAIGAGLRERLLQSPRLVVDAGVEAELVDDVAAFLRTAGDADGAAAPQLRELAHDAAHRARGGRDHHGFARLRPADLLQAEVGRHPGHAEDAEVVAERRRRAVHPRRLLRRAEELPAERREDVLALLQLRIPGLQHFAHRLPHHHLAQLDALGVALRVAHAAAHVRVEREPQVAHQHLALGGRRQRRLLHAEVVLRHPAGRAARQHDAAVAHQSRAKRSRWWSASPNCCARKVRRRNVWLTFSSSVIPMPPCSWIASWLTWRAASAILIFAAETARARSASTAWSALEHARQAMERACSVAITMSTMRCCSAWKVPIGTPNCLRVLRYSSVASQAYCIAPTASAQASAAAKSSTCSRRRTPPSRRSAGRPFNSMSAAARPSRTR